MTDRTPSGSRWEPVPSGTAQAGRQPLHDGRPRRRARLLALLLSVLTLGAATGGVSLARQSASVVDPGTTRPDVPAAARTDPRTGGGYDARGGRHHARNFDHNRDAPAAAGQEAGGVDS